MTILAIYFSHMLVYLVAIAWPAVYIGIYSGIGRVAPYGSSTDLLFATALAPIMASVCASHWIVYSVALNQPSPVLPVVKVNDLLLARSILEVAAACCMEAVILTIPWLIGASTMPHDVVGASLALASAVLLNVGVGCCNALTERVTPMWATGCSLLTIIFYMTLGVVFAPDTLPEVARQIFPWNPALHGAEWMRVACCDAYTSRALDKTYFIGSGVV